MADKPGRRPSKIATPPSKGPVRPPAARGSSGVVRRPAPAAREAPAEEGEEDAGQPQGKAPPPPSDAIRPTGVSLGIKFALATAFAVAIASGTLVFSAYSKTKDELDTEINDAGERMVKVLCGFDVATWNEFSQRKSVQTAIRVVQDIMSTIGNLTKDPESNPAAIHIENPDEMKKLQKAIDDLNQSKAKAISELTASTLPNPFDRLGKAESVSKLKLKNPAVLDIVVVLPDKRSALGSISAAGGSAQIGLTDRHPVKTTEEGLEIVEGKYSSGGGSKLARLFTYPSRTEDGSIGCYVQVYVSAEKIAQVQSRLLGAFLIPAIIAIAVGAGIGFFMASSIVKPVKILLHDIKTVSEGDLDHKTHAHSGDEIGLLAKAFNAMTQSLKLAHKAELETKALEHELNIATEIQSNLLPKRIPRFPGYDIGAFYRPSKEVGGDYYDFIQIDQDNLGIVVADVSGKGIPGSMVMTMARSLLRMEAERNLSTADTLVKTNRILARDIRRGMFVTCMYMVLNIRNRTLLVSSAGHNPLVVIRHATKNYELVNPNGIALGFDKGPIFERTVKEQRIQLFPGDRFCAYTDGVVESMSPDSVEFGDDKFYDMNKQLAAKTSNEFISTVVEALDNHQAKGPQHDDITLVTVRLLPN